MDTSLEQVFQYIATDSSEKQIYSNIIIKINEISRELHESLDNPVMASDAFNRLKKKTKDLESLVMLRKLYISGITDDPYSAQHINTVLDDPKS